jgi:hypothetical protein
MTSEQFCYWLQGYFELNVGKLPDLGRLQAATIRDHLNLVFNKVTPKAGDYFVEANSCFSVGNSCLSILEITQPEKPEMRYCSIADMKDKLIC